MCDGPADGKPGSHMRSSDHLQRFVRSRMVRLALALVLIALSAWAFFPHVGYRVATSAFVNAELVRVAAPIAGRLTRDLPHKGDFIEQTAAVPLIETLSRDQRHLLHLGSQYAVAKERADLARKQLEELAAADAELVKRTHIYRDGMIARLGHERDEATAEKTGCLAEAQQRREVGSRMEQLVKAGTASQIRTAEALATQEATSTRCEMASVRLQRLQTELASAKDGVFLRDGANDAPYSQQQRDRLLLRRQELETKVLEESLQASQIAAESAEERGRLDRLGRFELSLPAHHVVWSVAASPGSTVSEGQTLLDLAACEHRFVVVELPEREFEQIKAGTPAFVRLIGSDDWKQGQVRQVRGSAARVDDRLLAAQVPRPDPNSITVEIGLPQDDAQTERNNFCNIGRLAEVRFQRSGFSFLDGLGRKLQELAGYFKRGSAADRVASN
jgi:multidrug resistance efflux pump